MITLTEKEIDRLISKTNDNNNKIIIIITIIITMIIK